MLVLVPPSCYYWSRIRVEELCTPTISPKCETEPRWPALRPTVPLELPRIGNTSDCECAPCYRGPLSHVLQTFNLCLIFTGLANPKFKADWTWSSSHPSASSLSHPMDGCKYRKSHPRSRTVAFNPVSSVLPGIYWVCNAMTRWALKPGPG